MKPSAELFDLVKSLSKSEKRFFKLSSSLQTGKKNYLQIFDAIEKQSSYDELALKKQFKKETFVKHFPSEKNHLYKTILKSLRGYHADNSINSVLKQEIKNVEILYHKALYKECKKFLTRAKKVAKDYEKFYYWFELINWEKQLIEEEYERGIFTYDLNKLITEELLVIEKLRNLAEYQMIYSRINYIFRGGSFTNNDEEKKEVQIISNHHLIKGKNTAISERATSICYYIQGLCNITRRDFHAALEKLNRTKTILDNNSKIKQDLATRYVRTMKNLIFMNISTKNLDKAQQLINEMKKLPSQKGFNTIDVELKIFTFSHNTQVMVHDRRGEFEQAIATVDSMIEGLKKYENKLSKEQAILFYYNIAYIYFGVEDFKESLKWINKILNDNEQTLRQDVYTFSKIFNLIIHYELGNIDLLEYTIKSTSRHLKKTNKDYLAQDSIIKFIKKLIKLDNREDELQHFINGKKDLEDLFKDPNERIVQEYFDFLAWYNSKIDNTSFPEAIKKKLISS